MLGGIFPDRNKGLRIGRTPPASFNNPGVGRDGIAPGESELHPEIPPFVRFERQPRYFRRISVIVPVFVAAHMITGIIMETRQMIPLAFIVIPMSLITMFPDEVVRDAERAPSAT